MDSATEDPRTPDEDPRGQDVAEGGYPESQHPGAESGNDDGRKRRDDDTAPDTSSDDESDPGTATGNPRAAGA
jgi:hypothetical protein